MSLPKLSYLNLRRRPYQNLAIFFSLLVSYTLISFFVLVLVGSNQLLNYFSSQPQITAFIKKGIPQSQVNQLIINLQKTGVIKSIRYISSAEALKIYQKISNNPMLTDVISDDILPASLEISTYQPSQLEVVYKQLETTDIIDDIIYQRNLVHIISKWTKNIRIIGLTLILFFLFQTFITVWIVTGFKISGLRESIQIMRLLGASRRYVESIFILENTLLGSLAGLLSSLIVLFITRRSEDLILSFLGPTLKVAAIPYQYLYLNIGFSLIVGGAFSAWLTFMAVRRFIKD